MNAEWYINVYIPHEACKRARWVAEQAEKKRQHKESVARMVQVFEDVESQNVLGEAAKRRCRRVMLQQRRRISRVLYSCSRRRVIRPSVRGGGSGLCLQVASPL
jgi:hypothetical protein